MTDNVKTYPIHTTTLPAETRHVKSILKVLVIDDQYLIAMDAERILTAIFLCEVFIASRKFCSRALAAQKFDIVVLDIDPFHNDPQLLLEVCKSRNTAIILSSTHAELDEKARVRTRTAIVSKPYFDEQFRQAIAHVIEVGYINTIPTLDSPVAGDHLEADFANRAARQSSSGSSPITHNSAR